MRLSFAMICLAALAGSTGIAGANPEVRLEWVSKDGVEIFPPTTQVTVTDADIEAEIELVLRISLVLDEVAIHEFGFLVTFDDDFRDELDLAEGDVLEDPPTYGPGLFNAFYFDGVLDRFESDDSINGEIGPYRGCVEGSDCFFGIKTEYGVALGNRTVFIDEVTFIPTVNASNDRRDIVVGEFRFNEEFRDADGIVIEHSDIKFGFASVVPEPASSLQTATVLLTLALLARSRSRRVA